MSVLRNGYKIPPPADSIRHAISEAVIWPNLVPFRASFGSGRNKRLTNCSQNFSMAQIQSSTMKIQLVICLFALILRFHAIQPIISSHYESNGQNNKIELKYITFKYDALIIHQRLTLH